MDYSKVDEILELIQNTLWIFDSFINSLVVD